MVLGFKGLGFRVQGVGLKRNVGASTIRIGFLGG